MLVEFVSMVDAQRCAVEVQRAVVGAEAAQEIRIEFRVGINVGDIIIDGGDIYGDGVNIAARLEALAEPGGICISETVLSQARDKVSFEVEDGGEQTLKTIARPIHVYHIIVDPRQRRAASRSQGRSQRSMRGSRSYWRRFAMRSHNSLRSPV
jgi:adenylate cyclase